ncbi:MAG: hypothetical protein GY750_05595 [Lentisphaerae bacterium]|nr:hypothetical protein [Lentisphaerota bacterium]MCP4100882.1 hypothetical protein [Lentisphaerota bacterium]
MDQFFGVETKKSHLTASTVDPGGIEVYLAFKANTLDALIAEINDNIYSEELMERTRSLYGTTYTGYSTLDIIAGKIISGGEVNLNFFLQPA